VLKDLSILKNNRKIIIFTSVVLIIYLINLPIDFTKDLQNGLYRRMITSNDVIPNTFLPYLLINEGTFNFASIYNTLKKFDEEGIQGTPYFLISTSVGYVSSYPVLTGLFAAPIYFIPLVLNKIPELSYHENILKIAVLGRISASIYAALSAGIFYLICRRISKNEKLSLIFSVFYAFGTGTYSISSRALWMHTISQFIFSVTLFILLFKEDSKFKYTFLGILLGISVINRPTGIVMAVVLSFFILLYKRKYLLHFLIGVLPLFLVYLFSNQYFYGSIISEGYSARDAANEWTGDWLESMSAFLFSPARGILFISPPLLLGFAGMYKKIKKKDKLYVFLAIGYIASILLIGKWYAWHGANAFGHRMLVDYLPFIGIFSFLILKDLNKRLLGIVIILIVFSIYVHFNAVINRKSRCDLEENWTFYCLKWPDRPAQY